MSNERWRRIEEICHDALERAPDHRAAFVREACAGDAALRVEVESLLANQSRADALDSGLGIRDLGLDLIGKQIGVYRVISLLGTGGMGEVYRARDTKLGRDVAMKILPKLFASDPDRLARFEREARVLASLNHPHIGAIYGVEDADGIRALVLELVEGETLADRITRGPIPLTDTLANARQIADALDAAHERGIVHRDLKPANIKITREGVVKVLDFGLAKVFAGDASAPDLTQSPTVTVGGTHEGAILGTATYMSPEQARGKPVDKRTDIWAFGCVLYEMLTGRRAFEDEDVSSTLANVLKADPDWSLLPATTSREIRTLLRRCLQKEAKDRYHAAADIRIAIEDEISPSSFSAPAIVVQIPATGNKLRERLAWAAAGIAALAALAMAFLYFRSPLIPGSVTRFAVMVPPNERLEVSGCQTFALSPDGTHLAYIATAPGGAQQLYLRTTDGLETRMVVGVNRPSLGSLFFSPDGQWIGFWADRALKKVPLGGGTPVTLVNTETGVCGASWGPDNSIVYGTQKGLEVVSASGGPAKLLSAADRSKGERGYLLPEFLPGGRVVLFTIVKDNYNDAQVVVQSLETDERRTVIQGEGAATYVSAGYLVYPRARRLMATPFDPAGLKIRGESSSVLDGMVPDTNVSVSRTGSLAYIPAPQKESGRTLVWVDRRGQVQPLNAPPRNYADPRLSPDGRRLAVVVHEEGTNGDIWICDLDRGTLSRLTFDGNKTRPIWSPDGNRIAFGSLKERSLSWIAADGSGAEERLVTGQEVPPLPQSWSQDGLWLAYVLNPPATKSDIWILPLQGERKPRLFLQTSFYDAAPRFSPDGRWLVYHSDESGQYEIYARPFPGPGAKILISTGGASRLSGRATDARCSIKVATS
jgi:serine/threonine protein kinase/Tol biopolymer transport system component